jgi:predicted nucleic-acid-binding Zn-ribbon protein
LKKKFKKIILAIMMTLGMATIVTNTVYANWQTKRVVRLPSYNSCTLDDGGENAIPSVNHTFPLPEFPGVPEYGSRSYPNVVRVNTYHDIYSSLNSAFYMKIPLNDEMRNNASSGLGVDLAGVQDLIVVIQSNFGVNGANVGLQPQWVFADHVPEMGIPPGTVQDEHTSHTQFNLFANINMDARVFGSGNGVVSNPIRYDQETVSSHDTLYRITNTVNGRFVQNLWAPTLSPDNLHLGFNNDNQCRAILSYVDFNAGWLGGDINNVQIEAQAIPKQLTLNILIPNVDPHSGWNEFVRMVNRGHAIANILLNMYGQHYISREVMHYLLGFNEAVLNSVLDIPTTPIIPAPLRGAGGGGHIDSPLTEREKIVRIKEWFRNSGYTYELNQHNPDILVNTRRGNCVAFAALFQKKATDIGLQSRIMGTSTHAYNLVKIDNRWYIFDWCSFTCNYTENYRRLITMQPGHEEGIKQQLNREFCKFLGFNFPTADANLGNTSERYYTPASLCTCRPDGTCYGTLPVQNNLFRTLCPQIFDWDAAEAPHPAVIDPNITAPLIIADPAPVVNPVPIVNPAPIVNPVSVSTSVTPSLKTPSKTWQRPLPAVTPHFEMSPDIPNDNEEIWVQRAYNGKVHHYTANSGEIGVLVEQHHWTHEQAAFKCFKTPKEGRFPIFRLYNPNDKNGNHLLTISEPEKNWLVEQGWLAEEIEGYIPITNTMYRLYNEDTSEHFYTENAFEAQAAEAAGWKPDGTVW